RQQEVLNLSAPVPAVAESRELLRAHFERIDVWQVPADAREPLSAGAVSIGVLQRRNAVAVNLAGKQILARRRNLELPVNPPVRHDFLREDEGDQVLVQAQ